VTPIQIWKVLKTQDVFAPFFFFTAWSHFERRPLYVLLGVSDRGRGRKKRNGLRNLCVFILNCMSRQKQRPSRAVLPIPRADTSFVESVSRYCSSIFETTNLPTHLPRIRTSGAILLSRCAFRAWTKKNYDYLLISADKPVLNTAIHRRWHAFIYTARSRISASARDLPASGSVFVSGLGHAVVQLVEALRYNPEGRGFDSST